MTQTLEALHQGKENNFNLIRIMAAIFVIIGHSFDFLQFPKLALFGHAVSHIGVDIFFIISGYLVSKSFMRNPSIADYLRSRFLRIWPALLVNCLVLAFILAPLITQAILSTAFFKSAFNYLYYTLTLNLASYRSLPGVFVGTKYPMMNGVLWTLNYEIIMYCLLGIFGTLGMLKLSLKSAIAIMLMLIIITFMSSMTTVFSTNIGFALTRFSQLFLIGILFHLLSKYIRLNFVLVIAFILLAWLISLLKIEMLSYFISNLIVAYGVFWFAYLPKGFIRHYNKLGDYSYGLYIYGWPIGKMLMPFIKQPILLGISTIVLTFIPAILSWHFIEKYALAYNVKLREARAALLHVHAMKIQHRLLVVLLFSLLLFLFLQPLLNMPAWEWLRQNQWLA